MTGRQKRWRRRFPIGKGVIVEISFFFIFLLPPSFWTEVDCLWVEGSEPIILDSCSDSTVCPSSNSLSLFLRALWFSLCLLTSLIVTYESVRFQNFFIVYFTRVFKRDRDLYVPYLVLRCAFFYGYIFYIVFDYLVRY